MLKFATMTTLFLTLLVSPLMGEEKIMKCFPYSWKTETESTTPEFYKYKKSFFLRQEFFVRIGTKWHPFCKGPYNGISSKRLANYNILSRDIGDEAISCLFESYELTDGKKSKKAKGKLLIDFELNHTQHCYSPVDSNKLRCPELRNHVSCIVIDN
ncbi:MAG: hypothetical protein ACJZ8K_03535 [Paracoccaceae bacterium]